jgi:hypothetical protein
MMFVGASLGVADMAIAQRNKWFRPCVWWIDRAVRNFFVFQGVPQHALPLGSRSFVRLPVGGAQDKAANGSTVPMSEREDERLELVTARFALPQVGALKSGSITKRVLD